ncbi:MAG: DUF4131 domain-containing protein [Chloroflexi bacterium]|nr:DUF4131 domain-containing protein [Chloroflexota bacterium]
MQPLFWLSLAFMSGIVLASQAALSTALWLQLAAASLVGALAFFGIRRFRSRQHPRSSERPPSNPYSLIPVLFIFLFLGAARRQYKQPNINPFYIAWYNDREYEVLVTGTLTEPPDYRDNYTNLHLQVEYIDTGNAFPLSVHGLIIARVDPGETYHYGDRLRLRGYLKTPPENEEFSYREYLALHGIHAYMPSAKATYLPVGRGGSDFMAAVYALKERSLANIYRLFPDPEASLLAGILLGVDTGLSADLQQAFKDTGTTHIIAISGFNITIIAGLFIALFSRLFGPRLGAVAAVVGIAVYTILVGADAAVVRAAIMGGLSLFARQIGRRQDGMNTLAFVAAVMAYFNPSVLWDVGFELSFAATGGLILYAEPLAQSFVRFASRFMAEAAAQRLAGPVGEYVLFTLAAQLTTLPIMAYHFKRISLISLLANPFILPAQPAVMVLGGLALILSLFYFPLGKLAAMAAWPFVLYTIRVVELFGRLPHGVLILGDLSLLVVILFYAALLAWTFAGRRLKRFRSALTPAVSLSALAILAALTWRAAVAAPDGRLHVTILEAGSADAVLIQTPTGRAVLVNGGPSLSRLSDALGRRLPPFRRDLDWLVIAATQEDQVAALPGVLERFSPANVLWSGNAEASQASRRLDKYLTQNAIPVTLARPGHALDLGEGARLRVLAVGPRGAVLLIEWRSFRALLPIGMNFDDLDELENGAAVGPVTVLLLADSGYAPLNPPAWIDSLRPQLIVLDVAADDRSGLPHRGTLEAVQGYSLLRTDRNGWIHLSTDGERLWLETARR